MDNNQARQAAETAARHRLRGSDAVYSAVALRFGSTLITLDLEQQQNVAGVVSACAPPNITLVDVAPSG